MKIFYCPSIAPSAPKRLATALVYSDQCPLIDVIQLAYHLTNELSERSNALIKKISYTEYKHS